MKNFARRDDRNRFVDRGQRMSSAQNPFSGGAVQVSLSQNRPFDFAQAAKHAYRAANLLALKKHLFEDSLAKLAQAAELAPDRLTRMLDLDMPVDSEVAEHMEKSIGLRAGWLDVKRESWTEEELLAVQEQIRSAKREEEPEPEASRVFLVRETPAVPPVAETAVAPATNEQVPQKAEQNSPTPSRPTIAGYENSVHKEIKVIQISPELEWLNQELAQAPRGSRSKVAKLMERSPNDLSAWLNGLRVMPKTARAPLLRALHQFDQTLGEEAFRRFGADRDTILAGGSESAQEKSEQPAAVSTAAPAGVAQPVAVAQPAAQPVAAKQTAPAVSAKASLEKAAKSSEMTSRNAGTSTYVSFRSARNIVELDAIAMRTAQTLAEVLGSVMRRQEQAGEDVKSTVNG